MAKPTRSLTRIAPGQTEVTCEHCGRTYYAYPPNLGRFCTWDCRKLSGDGFSKKDRVAWSCEQCGATQEVVRSRSGKRFCGLACYNAWRREAHPRRESTPRECRVCGAEIYAPPSNGDRKKFCSRRCLALGQPARRTSKQADATIAILLKRHPDWNAVAEYNVNRWRIDLALIDWRIAIELDGDYWHSLPNVVKKDRAKNRHLHRNGWQVVRVTMAHEPPSQVADMVDDALASLGLLAA